MAIVTRLIILALLALTCPSLAQAQYPAPEQRDFILKDFKSDLVESFRNFEFITGHWASLNVTPLVSCAMQC